MIPNAWQGFDFGLGEDIDMLRETARNFSDDKIAPRADEIDKTNKFTRDLWPQMGELGLLGITVEEELGGSGMGYLAHCVAMEEVSRASGWVGRKGQICGVTASAIGSSRAALRGVTPRCAQVDTRWSTRHRG